MHKKPMLIMFVLLFISFFIDSFISENIKIIKNPTLDSIMTWVSNPLTMFFILIVVSSIFLYEERKKRYIPTLFLSFISAVVISFILKQIFQRIRPVGLIYDDLNIFGFPLSVPNYSFPSTHTSIAFSILPIVDREFPKVKIFWIAFSILIAFSRIYLNSHFFSDVIGGIILGNFIGHYFLKFEDKHGIFKRVFSRV